MVRITPLKPYLPVNPEEFCTKPYDVISKEEEMELKKNINSLIHLILPDGEGEEIYTNAAKAYKRFKDEKLLIKEITPSIFLYRQESPGFSHQGLIIGVSLQDYEDDNIVKHEHTREKPLKDRTKHITSTNASAGLVWTVYKKDDELSALIETIKNNKPRFKFPKYGYTHILWQVSDTHEIEKLVEQFRNRKLFIADGHHRAASAAEYRKLKLKDADNLKKEKAPWQYLLSYVASDDQIRILPYNRVVKKLPLPQEDFLKKLEVEFEVIPSVSAVDPQSKNQITICLKGKWYILIVRQKNFENRRDSLDVLIVQERVLDPLLGIKDIRQSDNIFFAGGIKSPKEKEKFITEKGNDLFINLFPVNIQDLEDISEKGGVMPPKSTWFDPKVLSGLVIHELEGD